uniref:Uncharacterized protein n=1 Tax=Rhizophora mucronata TaxID=61149 RepID=A0A2P2QB81_RHIMU
MKEQEKKKNQLCLILNSRFQFHILPTFSTKKIEEKKPQCVPKP